MAAAEPIVVVLSRDVEDLLPLFLAQRRADLARLGVALPARDFEAIRRLGHGMAGAGASYGIDHISVLGEQLAAAARAGNDVAIGHLKKELDDYMQRLQVVYM